MSRVALALGTLVLVTSIAAAEPPRVDALGDPLPEGAVFRIGTERFRCGYRLYIGALSPDGKLLATSGHDDLTVWDAETGKLLYSHVRRKFREPAFSPDGKLIAGVLSAMGFPCLLDTATGKLVDELKDDRLLNATVCRFATGGLLYVGDAGAIHVWDLRARKVVRTVSMIGAFSGMTPDQRLLLDVVDGEYRVREVGSRKEISRFSARVGATRAFSADSTTVAMARERGGLVDRWDLRTAKLLQTVRLDGDYEVESLAFSPDGKTLFCSTPRGPIARVSLPEGKQLPRLLGAGSAVKGFYFAPGGKTMVTTDGGGFIRRWDLVKGEPLPIADGYGPTIDFNCSADGKSLVVFDESGRADVWDLAARKPLRALCRTRSDGCKFAIAPGGRTVVSADEGGYRVWDTASGRQTHRIPFDLDVTVTTGHLAYSPNGRLAAYGNSGYSAVVLDPSAGKVMWSGHNDGPGAFSRDGTVYAYPKKVSDPRWSAGSIVACDAATGETYREIPCGKCSVESLAFSPDDRLILASTYSAAGETDVQFFETATGILRQTLAMPTQLSALALSPDGKWLAVNDPDGAIDLLELPGGRKAARLPGHFEFVRRLRFGPDRWSLLSAGGDSTVLLWDIRPHGLDAVKLGQLLDDLAGKDAAKAYRAVWGLAGRPTEACAELRERIRPVPKASGEQLVAWVEDLSSDRPGRREVAAQKLREQGGTAEAAIRHALSGKPSAGAQLRLGALLDILTGLPRPDDVHRSRAVQVLELCGTAEARRLLREWAGGAPLARLTVDAEAALKRLRE